MVMEPLFLTKWEREDHERRKRGEPERGPFGTGVGMPVKLITSANMPTW
jgi:hypothetical protein